MQHEIFQKLSHTLILITPFYHKIAISFKCQSFKSFFNDRTAEFLIFLRRKRGVRHRMGNGNRTHNTTRTNCLSNWYNCTNLSYRYTASFNFFRYHCAATSTCPSGRSKDYTVDMGILELCGDFNSKSGRIGQTGTVTGSRINRLIELFISTFLL